MTSRGQDNVRENGYAMAVLLVGMSIAAVMLTVAMPVWKQMARREKEEELVFRGQQYVHALRLFSRKYANASPPTLDVLVQQRFIRKKYKDPITNDDFQLVLAGQSVPGAPTSVQPAAGGTGAGTGTGIGPGRSGAPSSGFAPVSGQRSPNAPGPATFGRGTSPTGLTGGPGGRGTGPVGGVIGVVSKSKDKSIRLYNGRNHYNEWAFINTPSAPAPGAGAPGFGGPGQRGQPGGQRGQNPFGSQGPLGGRGPGSPNNPSGRPGGPGGPGQPQRGPQRGPGGFTPFQPGQPIQPIQPVPPGRGRGA